VAGRFDLCFRIDPAANVTRPPGGGATEVWASLTYTYPRGCDFGSTPNVVLAGTRHVRRGAAAGAGAGAGSGARGGAGAKLFLVEPADAQTEGEACVWVTASA
jgi:hypothetical protein